jgi:polyketide biosynthesis acyl carrier protein
MTKQEIFDVINRHVRAVLPRLENHDFKLTDSLKELGANSVDRSEIIMMTLETLSVSIPLVHMAKAQNIGELAGIIYEKS